MAKRTKKTSKVKVGKRSDRKKYPYVVFQVEKTVHSKCLKKAHGEGTSMSLYVENLIRKDLGLPKIEIARKSA